MLDNYDIHHPFETRNYQKSGISNLIDFVRSIAKGNIHDPSVPRRGHYSSAALVNVATGGGKTYICGETLNRLLGIRNRFSSIKEDLFPKLRIVVLGNEIDHVEQLRDNFLLGDKESGPILSENIRSTLDVSTIHSKAQKGDREISLSGDTMICATHHSSRVVQLEEQLDYVDIIIVEEGHNAHEGSAYQEVVDSLSKKGREGTQPLIIVLSGTPDQNTKQLYGDGVVNYPLEAHLASEYSPEVEYNLVLPTGIDYSVLDSIHELIQQGLDATSATKKRVIFSEIKFLLKELIPDFSEPKEFIDDMLARVSKDDNNTIEKTILYCSSVSEADNLAGILNSQVGSEDFAMTYHHKSEGNGMKKFRDEGSGVQVIIAINKLNEAIDVPNAKNIVMYRGTQEEHIFLQQFGRGLRGTGLVKYLDYVGGLQNFIWVNGLYKRYQELGNSNDQNTAVPKKTNVDEHQDNLKISYSTQDAAGIDLDIFIRGLTTLHDQVEKSYLDKDIIYTYCTSINVSRRKSFHYLMNLSSAEISAFKIQGHGVASVMRKSGYDMQGVNPRRKEDFYNWIKWIFQESHDVQTMSRGHVENYFLHPINDGQTLSGDDAYEYWRGKNIYDIRDINIFGNKIQAIMKVSGWNHSKGLDRQSVAAFKQWVDWLFGKEVRNSQMNLEEIKNYFFTEKSTKQQSYEYWVSLGSGKIGPAVEYKGIKLTALASIYGGVDSTKAHQVGVFRTWIAEMFSKEEFEGVPTEQEVKRYFYELTRSIDSSYAYLMSLDLEGIKDLEFRGMKIDALSALLGRDENRIGRSRGLFRSWVQSIFPEDITIEHKHSLV